MNLKVKLYNLTNKNHFESRFIVLAIVYTIFFFVGLYFDEQAKNQKYQCMGPSCLLINVLFGNPVAAVVLLIDIFILAFRKEFTAKKFLLNLLLLGIFILLSLMPYTVMF